MAPPHPCVSPRVPPWLCSWPWCESPRPLCPVTGRGKKTRRGCLVPLHAGKMPATGRLHTGEPQSLTGEVLPSSARLRTLREAALAGGWQQTLQTAILEMRAAVSQDQALSPRAGLLDPALGGKGAFTA